MADILSQHILRSKGDLRVAVLVSEFADVDIDSVLLKRTNNNATLGIPYFFLPSALESFRDSLKTIFSVEKNFDILILETSGVADPEPIVNILEAYGIVLDKIVTVVDSEDSTRLLESPIARRQLAIADIVLVNKCDVASLGQVADVEDIIEAELKNNNHKLLSDTKILRTRFCAVPLEVLLEASFDPPFPVPLGNTTANDSTGFLSHEASNFRSVQNIDPLKSQRKSTGKARPEMTAGSQISFEVEPFFSTAIEMETPVSLAEFQEFVVNCLRKSTSILRAKGILWFSENRKLRYTFHYSGRYRCEASVDGIWDSPPAVQIVLIGQNLHDLESLKRAFLKSPGGSQLEAATSAFDLRNLVENDSRFEVEMFWSPF